MSWRVCPGVNGLRGDFGVNTGHTKAAFVTLEDVGLISTETQSVSAFVADTSCLQLSELDHVISFLHDGHGIFYLGYPFIIQICPK